MWNREPIGGPFALVDHNGKPRTDADFRGKVRRSSISASPIARTSVPTDLQNIGLALDQLGSAGDAVQPLFVTLDPGARYRRAPEGLRPAVSSAAGRADRRCGSDQRRGRRLPGLLRRGCPTRRRDDYTVDHSAFIYLVDRSGKYLGFLPPGTDGDRIAEAIRAYLGKP